MRKLYTTLKLSIFFCTACMPSHVFAQLNGNCYTICANNVYGGASLYCDDPYNTGSDPGCYQNLGGQPTDWVCEPGYTQGCNCCVPYSASSKVSKRKSNKLTSPKKPSSPKRSQPTE
jgi:hypothetical protein